MRLRPFSWLPRRGEPPDDLYGRAASDLTEQGWRPLRECLFATPDLLPTLLDQRERRWVSAFGEGPVALWANRPAGGGRFAGLRVLAVSDEARVEPLWDGAQAAGRVAQSGGERWLSLQGLVGRDPAGRMGSLEEQAQRMFERAERLLAAQGSHPREVVGLWPQGAPLALALPALTAARDGFYTRSGIRSGRRLQRPPAGAFSGGEHPRAAAWLDLLAAQGPLPRAVRPAGAPSTSPACEGFSAAVVAGPLALVSAAAAEVEEGGEGLGASLLAAWRQAHDQLEAAGGDAARAGWTLCLRDPAAASAWRELVDAGSCSDQATVAVLAPPAGDDVAAEFWGLAARG